MKVFWNDCGEGCPSEEAQEVDLEEAQRIWSDEVRGVRKNFYGLIDDQDRTIQFYFDAGIPDGVDDASHLEIVDVDIPVAEKRGSYIARVALGEVPSIIEKAFQVGANYRRFPKAKFAPW